MEIQGRPSRTALITCLMRTLHTRYDCPALIDDLWADRWVLPEERREMVAAALAKLNPQQIEHIQARGEADSILHALWCNTPVYGGVVVRSRYAEDKVQAAARRGIRQYVLIGAGFDSFALRQPEWARDMQIFEVDHPSSQQLKHARLSNLPLPPNLHFVPADLSREALGTALSHSAFKPDEPAIMSWLGVTVYLTHAANMATLRSIGEFAAPSSELVFTYIEQRALESNSPRMHQALAMARALGEPWLSGFDPATLWQELAPLGWERIEDVGSPELAQRYCQGRTDGFTLGKAGRIAWARVQHLSEETP